MAATQSPARPKLPFGATIAEAFTLPFHHAGDIVRLTWGWALLLAVATGGIYRLLDDAQLLAMQKGDTFGPAGLNLLSLLVGLVVGASVAVGWHRLLLAGEGVSAGAYLRFDDTVWRYIAAAGTMMLVTLPFLATVYAMANFKVDALHASGPPQLTGDDPARMTFLALALLVSFPVAMILTTRWSLVLPARAMEATGFGLADSWAATRGNFWRLLAGTFVCYLPALAAVVLIGGVIGTEPGAWRFIVANMLSAIAGLVTTVFPLGFLTLAYKHLVSPRLQ